jgi:hypothetical protein
MWAAAAAVAFSSFAGTNNKNYFLSPELAKPASGRRSGSTLDIFYYLLGLFLYSLRASVWVRVIKNSSPTCMMNKAASERWRKRISLMTLQQRKREEEECLGTAPGVVPPKLAPNCKINLFSLVASQTGAPRRYY